MKPSHLLIIMLLFLTVTSTVIAQTQSYYVVIGAFRIENNAKKFSGFSKSRFFQSTYELNPSNDLFFVYVIKTDSKKDAFDQVRLLQKEEAFHDSWVYRGTLGTHASTPVVEKEPEPPYVTPVEPTVDSVAVMEVVKEEPQHVDSTAAVITTPTEPVVKAKRVVKGKLFKFDIQTPDGQPMVGNVHHVDLLKGRDIATYSSSDYSDVPKPAEEPMTLVCGIFGYKEITHVIDYENPTGSEGVAITVDSENAWVVPFKLETLKKGDVSVMYDVSFFKDAVAMVPRSQEELDELVNLMKANPKYEIKIHGHTNGNNKRRIYSFGKTKNYFAMEGMEQSTETAKELSKQRAEAIRDYLVDHSIEKGRIDIQAWGGLNMLVGEGSSSSRLNDRIEIEIMAD